MKTRFRLAVAAAALALSTLAYAQAWPAKPVRIIVPYPPGGAVDVVTRKMAAKLQEQTGQTVANPGLGLVWVLNQRAEPELVLKSCAGTSLTNIAFGGPERKTLYCTESVTGTVLRATLDIAGLPIDTGVEVDELSPRQHAQPEG